MTVSSQTSNISGNNAVGSIEVRNVSKWFGSVVAVNDISMHVPPGITGLLGPNGAGKTTLLRMITGLSAPSSGEVRIFGEPIRNNVQLYSRLGVMSEHESVYQFLTGRQFVEFAANLHNLTPPGPAVDRAIDAVGLADVQGRQMGTYSRGMRQRMRLAASMVHEPEVLVLDEPLNGTDPRQRLEFHELMRQLADRGNTILISSHILEEVETLASNILLMISGKLAASGDYRAIREKLGFPYWTRDWMQMHASLFAALRMEKTVMFIILVLITLVATFSIVATLIMVVKEKARDIAILKSMGATDGGVLKIFMVDGMTVGAVGTLLGMACGISLALKLPDIAAFLENQFGLEIFQGSVYLIDRLPVDVQSGDVALIVATAFGLCSLATLYPAWKASRVDPAETLRYE